MKNKTRFIQFTLAITLLSPLFSSAQEEGIPSQQLRTKPLETIGDHYLPNAYQNKKTSPSYQSTNSSVRTTTIFTIQVNVDSDANNIEDDAANEPNIALNPQNENEIVIGWRQFDNVSSNFRQAGWSYTSDGGQTWTFPGVLTPGTFRSDPVLDFDTAGNFFYNSLTVDNFGNYTTRVFKSTDGGSTWDNGTPAHGGDKQWMAIDRTEGDGSGNIYSFWSSGYSSCFPGDFTRSTDDNDSYEECSVIDGDPFWGNMSIGTDGELYIVGGGNFNDLVVAKSLTAQEPDSTVDWNTPVQVFMDGNIGFGGTVNPGGLLGQANIDVDRSNGPGQGYVYVLAALNRSSNGDPGDIMFSRSKDGGLTWSSPIAINDDGSTSNSQWIGTMSVAPTGRIDAVWLDTRDNPGFDSSALYYSYSIDQGDTWSANEKLSHSFNPHVGYPNQNKMGDYFDMISDSTGAHLAWANTLNGEEDVYYSHITPQIATSVNEVHNDHTISIYPNPSNGIFVVTNSGFISKNFEGASQIEIFNTLGKKIISITELNSKNEVDISSEPAGIYFLKMIHQDGSFALKKVIKE